MALFRQLEEAAAQIPTKDDFGFEGDSMVDRIVNIIKAKTGIDLSDLLSNVAPWIEEGVATVRNIVNQVIDIFNGVIVTPINAAIGVMRDWFLGIFTPGSGGFAETTGIAINTMQNQLQVLQGVIGYGSWVMSQNIFIGLNQGDLGVRIPNFDAPQGPKVGCELYTDPLVGNRRIVKLLSRGLWEIKAQTKARNTGYTGNDKIFLDIVIRRPDGTEYYRRAADALADKDTGDGEAVVQNSLFVVVPAPGYTVHTEIFTGRWRWFYGGSLWSGLSVLKHSSEVENEGTVSPGDPPVAG